jgi:hypothetical protein
MHIEEYFGAKLQLKIAAVRNMYPATTIHLLYSGCFSHLTGP